MSQALLAHFTTRMITYFMFLKMITTMHIIYVIYVVNKLIHIGR